MEKLNKFISYIEGTFNNDNQIKEEESLNKKIRTPNAKHIIKVCNDKIVNLPEDFKGYFTIDETYYNNGEKETSLHHLFLYTLNEDNNVVLTSYELPSNIEYKDFINSNDKMEINYNNLKLSDKFNPIVFEDREEYFLAESKTNFSPEIIFTAIEKVYNGRMYVTEIFKKDGVIVSGSEEPIIYDRIS